jgi:hypothetical protein
VREARCVACGRTASEQNTYADADGAYTLIQLPKFAICESCVPTCSETMIEQDSDMEPEEAILRCWFSDFKNRSIPFSELAERIMDRDRMIRDALLDAVDEDVAGLHTADKPDAAPRARTTGYNAGLTDARAAIRARKETT